MAASEKRALLRSRFPSCHPVVQALRNEQDPARIDCDAVRPVELVETSARLVPPGHDFALRRARGPLHD
eukprot:CAMPEP_0115550678 /NCGR_PEP_ID=MMETSP0271-20121206/95345_1 /TAXON_ID=71861 /ORGANISM="Scrippsiella trochoidea, Strain CCMP3099" /LENGTH=68 /DNA_ID=CAMNT_0002984267 /DNA_START=452 /DNA_END=655 /DNA_ORIENTATION=-